MIQDNNLIAEINSLPPDELAEVVDFVARLKARKSKVVDQSGVKERPRLTFGCMKGIVKYMADNFDEPLEDFAEYM